MKLEWFAYIHRQFGFRLMRFWGDYGDVAEAKASPEVINVTEPFTAINRERAYEKARELLLPQAS